MHDDPTRMMGRPGDPEGPRGHGNMRLVVAGLIAVIVGLAIAIAVIANGDGSDDPDAELVVKKGGAIVRERTKEREIALRAGAYTVELADPKPGLRVVPEKVEITERKPAHVRVILDRPRPPVIKSAPQTSPDRKAAEYVAEKPTDVVLEPVNLCSETLDGIRNHSWSRPAPATPEGEVVSWADRIAYVCHDFEDAAALGYDLEELSYDVEGDLDLRNCVGIEDGPRPGVAGIRVNARAKARNATQEQLEELCRYVQKTSPVGDVIANPVPIQVSLTAA